ncbi:MAG TPA: sigma-70 family RNA polymerase sigma factor [Gemmataceae bacterium]|nr:sigma-70 family RNA polymerase sigma factor [Gemmataceae bacterium]
MNDLSQKLQRLALLPNGGVASDEELLQRFLHNREETAFEALVRRHGPMVLGVCRRALHDQQLAEDAFQATFLILVRKAGSIRKREAIASWLYGVAYRTAARARRVLSRRRAKERPMHDFPSPQPPETSRQDLGLILDEELLRLSEIYRTPVVLCDLEGKTRKEAARLVGCPEGTLSTRLLRARALLARRLKRRGVVLAAGSLELVLSQHEACATVSSSLLASTVRGAASMAFGQTAGAISPHVAALAEGLLKTMLWTPALKVAAVVLSAGLICTGLALPAFHMPARAPNPFEGPDPQPSAQQPAPPTNPVPDALRKILTARVTLDKGIDQNTPLKDAMEFLADRYDVSFTVDTNSFNAKGIGNVEDLPVGFPRVFHVRLATVLQRLAKQVKGICLISGAKIILVPDDEKIVKELLAKGYARLPAALPNEDAQSKVFFLLSNAYRKTIPQLRSGSGTGTFEVYVQRPSDNQPRLRSRAKFTLDFDHKRYYLRLNYDQGGEFARQVIICDNSAVYSSSFLDRPPLDIHSSFGEVRGPEHGRTNNEFHQDPSQLTKPLFNVDEWIRTAGDNIRIEEVPDGYTIHLQEGKIRKSCSAFKEFDWNVSDAKSEFDGRRLYVQETKATWKRAGDIWYVASAEKIRKGGDLEESYRAVFRFDDFKANAAISPKLFHLSALELPTGARIFDRREDAPNRAYLYCAIPEDESRRYFDMEAELESLPARNP